MTTATDVDRYQTISVEIMDLRVTAGDDWSRIHQLLEHPDLEDFLLKTWGDIPGGVRVRTWRCDEPLVRYFIASLPSRFTLTVNYGLPPQDAVIAAGMRWSAFQSGLALDMDDLNSLFRSPHQEIRQVDVSLTYPRVLTRQSRDDIFRHRKASALRELLAFGHTYQNFARLAAITALNARVDIGQDCHDRVMILEHNENQFHVRTLEWHRLFHQAPPCWSCCSHLFFA